ncbi:uncharacterized protein LOC131946713 [Physella acuta]|uniref:uncharacterized protein LOC131946713 n=1 Tax=Physella acuta TaxID=109671 RepID=UPI0027DC5F0A|nr:uncharacterized protein LOC131946713 [Physella acuta]
MIPLLKLVLSAAIAYHVEAGTVKLNVSLPSHTFEGSLTVGSSSHDRFKSCIIDELFSGIQIRDMTEIRAFSNNYRLEHFGTCDQIDSIHINVNYNVTSIATMNCSKFVQAKCEMYCEAVFATADINTSIKALQNHTSIQNCIFKLRKIVNPISGQVRAKEVLENSDNKNLTSLVLGIAFGAAILVIFIAFFTSAGGKFKRFKMFTKQVQKCDDFCLAEVSDALNSRADLDDCPDNIYSTLDGDGDPEAGRGEPDRGVYSLPAREGRYSVCLYENMGVSNDQAMVKVDGDLLKTVDGYQDDYIDVIDRHDHVVKMKGQIKVEVDIGDSLKTVDGYEVDYIDVTETSDYVQTIINQAKIKVNSGDPIKTVNGYQVDNIDVTETSDYVQTIISQAKVKVEGADLPTTGNGHHDDYIDVTELMLMYATPS